MGKGKWGKADSDILSYSASVVQSSGSFAAFQPAKEILTLRLQMFDVADVGGQDELANYNRDLTAEELQELIRK